jgi:hypothetical protein
MIWPPQNTGVFAPAQCVVCCVGVAPLTCQCALLIPITYYSSDFLFSGVYDNVDTANNACANSVANCVAYCLENTRRGNLTAFSANVATANVINVSVSMTADANLGIYNLWAASVNLNSGSTLSINCTISGTSNASLYTTTAWLYKCDNNEVGVAAENVALPATIALPSSGNVASSGEYYLILRSNTNETSVSSTVNYAVTCSNYLSANPVVSRYNDAGTTQFWEACPRNFIPPFYIPPVVWQNYATANNYVTDPNFVFDCVGYELAGVVQGGTGTFSATDYGSNIALSGTDTAVNYTTYFGTVNSGTCGLRLRKGSQLSANYTYSMSISPDTSVAQFELYDANSILVDVNTVTNPSSGTYNYTVPYSGKFYTLFLFSGTKENVGNFSDSWTLTYSSNAALDVLPLAAAYENNPNTNCYRILDC